MYNVRKVTETVYWIGGSDRRLALFENIFPIQRGVSYNAYVVLDEKTVLLDTVDSSISKQFFEKSSICIAREKVGLPYSESHGTGPLCID